jgi:homospermidine synthase
MMMYLGMSMRNWASHWVRWWNRGLQLFGREQVGAWRFKDERTEENREKLEKASFAGNVVIIGCGSVSQCTLPILLKETDISPTRVTVVDFVDNRERIQQHLTEGVTYIQHQINEENYATFLGSLLKSGDLLIDLGWNIDTVSLIEWCREHGVLFVNTSVEAWNPYQDPERKDPREYTLYMRQMQLRKMVQRWGRNDGPTAIVDHGANPGLVSHFTKHALRQICERILADKPKDKRAPAIVSALEKRDFKSMAHLANVQVIHVSERDTQSTHTPKRVNEFVNTWSIEGLYEEGVAPAEMGWGTHERTLPPGGYEFQDGPRNAICLSSLGVNTLVRSWVPSGPIVGMVIRHGEAYGISDRLTVWHGNKAAYRPTVHYVYCPSDATIASLHELRMRQYKLQSEHRILNDEIVEGWDELGVLLMGHDFNAWWAGTVLDIHAARALVPNQNATTVQVAISVVSAAMWMFKNPRSGFLLPDDVDEREVLSLAKKYLGRFVSEQVAWNPLRDLDTSLTAYGSAQPDETDMWQFGTFCLGAGILR